TARESSVVGTVGVVTVIEVYGPLRMHFRKASPFGLVSMYRKNHDRHCAYRPIPSIGGRSLEPAVSKAVDEIVTDAVDWAIHAPLRDRFRDLPEADMKEILHHRMWESNSYQAYEDHKMLYEALEKSMACDHTDQLLTDYMKYGGTIH
ncbi:hypothetical protein Tco_1554886, partial [Tanacetum coccineum]